MTDDRSERDAAVWQDPELAERIRWGVEQAERGETVDRGSFAHFLDDEDDAGPDLPPPDQPITPDVALHRWPSGTEKAEVIRGALVFTPLYAFDERDVDAARRTYPGRYVGLAEGALWVSPADAEARATYGDYAETLTDEDSEYEQAMRDRMRGGSED